MQEIIDFMLEKIGGEENLRKEFLKNKLASLNVLEMTACQLMDAAKAGGWDKWLSDLTLEEFQDLIHKVIYGEEEVQAAEPTAAIAQSVENEPKKTGSWVSTRAKSPVRTKRRRRLPKPVETIEHPVAKPVDIITKILDFIRNNPWSDGDQIAKNVELVDEEAAIKLTALKDKGWIKVVGSSQDARYALN